MQAFAGGAAIAAASPLAAIALAGDLYVNHKMGLAVRKPSSWRFEHVRTFADIRNEYDYAALDEQLAADLRNGPLPILVVAQGPVLTSLCSSMTIYVEETPLGEGETLQSVFGEIVEGTGRMLEQFKLEGEPDFTPVCGYDATDYRATFLYRDRLGHVGPVRHRSLAVSRRPFLFTFNMLDIPADGKDATVEFKAIKDAVRVA